MIMSPLSQSRNLTFDRLKGYEGEGTDDNKRGRKAEHLSRKKKTWPFRDNCKIQDQSIFEASLPRFAVCLKFTYS